jgi:hypothetical protein
MNRISTFFLAIISTASICSSNTFHNHNIRSLSKQIDSLTVYGKWKVINFVPAPISEITVKEAQRYIGKVISLNASIVVVIADTCDHPFFKAITQNSNKYFLENRMDKADLKIQSDSITVIKVGCNTQPNYSNQDSPNFLYDFIIDDNQLIVSFKGFYFYLKRIN